MESEATQRDNTVPMGAAVKLVGRDVQSCKSVHNVERVAATTLDRVHQSKFLFGAGRSDALKRFLVEDGAGNDIRFWTLSQALSALWSTGSDEKRWVGGALARKKGLGF